MFLLRHRLEEKAIEVLLMLYVPLLGNLYVNINRTLKAMIAMYN